jgi:hypothetical protein
MKGVRSNQIMNGWAEKVLGTIASMITIAITISKSQWTNNKYTGLFRLQQCT